MLKKFFNVKIFHCRDISIFAISLQTSPIYVEACESFPDGPLGGQTAFEYFDESYTTAITW